MAANYLIEKICKKILILDLDVHQGNGTAEIFQQNKNVFTVSFHGKTIIHLEKKQVILIMVSLME